MSDRSAVANYVLVFGLALSAGAGVAQTAKPAPPSSSPAPAASASAAVAATAAPATPPKPGDAAAGQAKAAACGACHGMDGNSSDAQYPKLAGQHEAYIALQLESFKNGKRQNPIMLGMATPLSEQDMHDIGAYFASKRSLPGVADQALVAQGEKLFRQGDVDKGVPACMACHSIDGRGNPGALYPQLAGQHAQYVEATLKAWHDGTHWGDDTHAQIMQGIAQKLDPAQIAAVASYVEGLHATDAAPSSAPASP